MQKQHTEADPSQISHKVCDPGPSFVDTGAGEEATSVIPPVIDTGVAHRENAADKGRGARRSALRRLIPVIA